MGVMPKICPPKIKLIMDIWGGGGMLQSTIKTNSTAGSISLPPNSNIHSFE
jgi:hypothetical protein